MIPISQIPDDQLFFYDKKGFEKCCICMETIYEKDQIILKCNHTFHASCMMENIIHTNNTCPLCRVVVSTKPKKIPDFNARIRSNLIANTIHENLNELSQNLSENLFPEVQHNNNRTNMKGKLEEILTIFGLSLTTNIQSWIQTQDTNFEITNVSDEESSDDATDYEESSDEDNYDFRVRVPSDYEDHHELLEPLNLVDNLLPRLIRNSYFRDFDNVLNSDIETFMYPPGRYEGQEPYFTRNESEQLLNAVIRHFANYFEDF